MSAKDNIVSMAPKTPQFDLEQEWAESLRSFSQSLPEIRFVEYTHWEVGKRVGAHSHADMFQLDHFPGGEGTYSIGGRKCRINSRQFFFVEPNSSHEIVSSSRNLLVNLTVKFVHNGMGKAFLPTVLELPSAVAREASEQFRSVISAGVLGDAAQKTIAACRLAELLVRLRQHWEHSSRPESEDPLVAGAKAYMRQHLGEPLTLADLGRSLGVAPEHLCRTFKNRTGTSPFEYLRQLRVQRARQLLEQSSAKVLAVARQAGFGSSVQMNRVFQKYLGTTPRAYRKSLPLSPSNRKDGA